MAENENSETIPPTFLTSSSLSYGGTCTDGFCGLVSNGDNIGLDFSEKMKSAAMGTTYHVVIEPDGTIRLYKGGSSTSPADLVATMTGNNNVNDNGGASVTFTNSEGIWMNDDTHLRISLRNKNGSTSNMGGAHTVFTIGEGAIDLAGNKGNGESTTSDIAYSRW